MIEVVWLMQDFSVNIVNSTKLSSRLSRICQKYYSKTLFVFLLVRINRITSDHLNSLNNLNELILEEIRFKLMKRLYKILIFLHHCEGFFHS